MKPYDESEETLLGDTTSIISHPAVTPPPKPADHPQEPVWVLDLMQQMDTDMARQQAAWAALRKPAPRAAHPWRWVVGGAMAVALSVAGLLWWLRTAPTSAPQIVAMQRMAQPSAPRAPAVSSVLPSMVDSPMPVNPSAPPAHIPVVPAAPPPSAAPFIGAVVSDMRAIAKYYRHEEPGLVVTAVYPDSPAAQAGVQDGDLVIAWNNRPVREAADVRLDDLRVDEEVVLEVQHPKSRDAERLRLRVVPTPPAAADLNGVLEWYASRIAIDPENPLNYYFRATTYSANCTQITGPTRPEWCTPSADAAYLRDAYETVRRMPSWTEAQAEYAQAQLLVKGHVTTER